ncbi:MAG TPA: YlmC/YmxH family sporulation protein [Lachnospiraceae bacterium]|nr:YlmC/YmxH family sporulation protein [Lachnospiraceae bacterium]
MLFSEFKCKEVINLKNCKCLGKVSDLEFDERTGCIHKIIVPRGNRWESFFKCQEDYEIPYRDIKQIGPDIILVDICID